jgi:hypothetical protein
MTKNKEKLATMLHKELTYAIYVGFICTLLRLAWWSLGQIIDSIVKVAS